METRPGTIMGCSHPFVMASSLTYTTPLSSSRARGAKILPRCQLRSSWIPSDSRAYRIPQFAGPSSQLLSACCHTQDSKHSFAHSCLNLGTALTKFEVSVGGNPLCCVPSHRLSSGNHIRSQLGRVASCSQVLMIQTEVEICSHARSNAKLKRRLDYSEGNSFVSMRFGACCLCQGRRGRSWQVEPRGSKQTNDFIKMDSSRFLCRFKEWFSELPSFAMGMEAVNWQELELALISVGMLSRGQECAICMVGFEDTGYAVGVKRNDIHQRERGASNNSVHLVAQRLRAKPGQGGQCNTLQWMHNCSCTSTENNETEEETKEEGIEEESAGVHFAVSALKFYKREISPYIPGSCRYVPTCSEYGMQAFKKYGVVKGAILTACRLSRCNPLGGSGFDPPRWFGEDRPPSY